MIDQWYRLAKQLPFPHLISTPHCGGLDSTTSPFVNVTKNGSSGTKPDRTEINNLCHLSLI